MGRSPAETCWTCRIRKKRCDRKRPACGACRSLDITCYDGNSRPGWVDNFHERDEFAKQIKNQVREKAESRREKSYVIVMPLERAKESKDGPVVGQPSKRDESRYNNQVQDENPAEPSSHVSSSNSISLAEGRPPEKNSTNPALLGISEDIDIDLEITFLDYAFPFLFPFYRPSIYNGGRGWLLATLRKSMPLFHTAMGFSTYFFTLLMTDIANGDHETCKRMIEGKLINHVDTAIKAMRKGIEDLGAGQKPVSIFERAHLMEGVIQLLVFETNIAGTTEWGIHINAAVSLFKELFELRDTPDGRTDIGSLLAMMQRPGWGTETPNYRIWNPDQGAFLFHVAFIIFADIISATILGDAPKLREYYPLVFNDRADAVNPKQLLDMNDFVGCQGCTLLLIADIATLVEGKKQGRVSRNDLLIGGDRIAKGLHDGIATLKATLGRPIVTPTSFFQAYSNPESLPQAVDTISYNLIWAHATVLYLFVTTSGWQEQHDVVQVNTTSALQLLQNVSSPAILRSLAWPFCVVGCLASTNQEETFRQIASRMGSLSAFGTLCEALKIMEQVWNTRGEKDVENWDFTYCFRILGSMPLLI